MEFIEAKLCADGKTEELANLAKAQKERRIFAETKSVNPAYYKPIFALQK